LAQSIVREAPQLRFDPRISAPFMRKELLVVLDDVIAPYTKSVSRGSNPSRVFLTFAIIYFGFGMSMRKKLLARMPQRYQFSDSLPRLEPK
jgi:hypothetical protein